MSFHHPTVSIKYAWEGVVHGLKTQPNFRIHLILSLVAIIASYYFQISNFKFLIILLLVGLGLAIEYLNTAIEYTVDLMTDKHHLLAKHAKDCAAAGMLIFSVFTTLISAIIFLPEIILWLSI